MRNRVFRAAPAAPFEVKSLHLALHAPEHFVDDATSPDILKSERADFLFAGFPCQPFSMAGLRQGVKDERGRGAVVFHIVQWIKLKLPKVFLLENVVGMLTSHKDVLANVLQLLSHIQEASGKVAYDISWKTLNARSHGGLPHNRERLCIAGVRKISPLPSIPLLCFPNTSRQNALLQRQASCHQRVSFFFSADHVTQIV